MATKLKYCNVEAITNKNYRWPERLPAQNP